MTEKSAEQFETREFPMTLEDFRAIQAIAYKKTGIKLSDHKKNMIYSRLARRLRRLELDNFRQYCQVISQSDSPEMGEFVNAITTNLTAFFRENHHFEYLSETVIPHLLKSNASNRRIRVWSAGCSTGEEPYSIAMVLRSFSALNNWDVKILATDLDTNVVAHGKAGLYSIDRADSIPEGYRKHVDFNKHDDKVKMRDSVRSLISFKQLNLLGNWPMKGPFDVIFCRNVVIYFDIETQRKLFDRYANLLAQKSTLFIGHSENLHNVSKRFESLGRTIYEKIE